VNLYNGQAQKSVLQCNSNGHMQCAPTMGAQIKSPVNLYNGQAQKSVLQCNSNGHMQCAPTMSAQIKLPVGAHCMCPRRLMGNG